jgi:hypothetical protein
LTVRITSRPSPSSAVTAKNLVRVDRFPDAPLALVTGSSLQLRPEHFHVRFFFYKLKNVLFYL